MESTLAMPDRRKAAVLVRSLAPSERLRMVERLTPMQRAVLAGALLELPTVPLIEQLAVRDELSAQLGHAPDIQPIVHSLFERMTPTATAQSIGGERPAVLAAVLFSLPPKFAAQVVAHLTAECRAAALRHLATGHQPDQTAARTIEAYLHEQSPTPQAEQSHSLGANRLAEIFHCAGPRQAAQWQAELARDASLANCPALG